jgi:hypothetical protein
MKHLLFDPTTFYKVKIKYKEKILSEVRIMFVHFLVASALFDF